MPTGVQPAETVNFNINDSDAVPLNKIEQGGVVESIVGKLSLVDPPTVQNYFRNGKHRSEKMQESLISDGTRTLKITFWADMLDIIEPDCLVQICNVTTKIMHNSVVLNTNCSTTICKLTADISVQFDETV